MCQKSHIKSTFLGLIGFVIVRHHLLNSLVVIRVVIVRFIVRIRLCPDFVEHSGPSTLKCGVANGPLLSSGKLVPFSFLHASELVFFIQFIICLLTVRSKLTPTQARISCNSKVPDPSRRFLVGCTPVRKGSQWNISPSTPQYSRGKEGCRRLPRLESSGILGLKIFRDSNLKPYRTGRTAGTPHDSFFCQTQPFPRNPIGQVGQLA